MPDFTLLILWFLIAAIVWDEQRACGGRSIAVEIFSQIRITKTQVLFGLLVGFIVKMFILAVTYAAQPSAQGWICTALVCVIPTVIMCGGKLAHLLDEIFKKEISPTNALIFRAQEEKITPIPLGAFRSITRRPEPPPPRSSLA